MNTSPFSIAAIPAAGSHPTQFKKTFRAWLCVALLLALSVVQVAAQDDDYIAIIGITDQADALSASGKTAQAREKYIEAQQALTMFQRANPGWNTPTVSFRIKYLREKIAATSGRGEAAGASASSAGTKPETVAAKSPVKLLAAGAEPRKVFRFHPTAGDKQTIVMTLKMAMEMGMAGNKLPAMDIPPMQMTMDVEAKNISADGDISFQMEFTDATVEMDTNGTAVMAAALKTSLAEIRGLTGTGKMTAQGIVKSLEMKLPAGAAPQLGQTAGQMKDAFSSSTTALPEEAIGVGAKWETKTKAKTQGVNADQTVTYELVSLEGDQLTLRSTVTETASSQKMDSPMMPGMKVDLNKFTSTGSGTTVQELGKIMPQSVSMDQETLMNMGMNLGQQKQKMDMKMTMKISMESK